ncbi:Erv1 / Alr family [Drosophila suzukii associated hytrosavirus 1]|nr:Erv1 / Alr family [Drosophila suzukii associated hytrosavirus 1]
MGLQRYDFDNFNRNLQRVEEKVDKTEKISTYAEYFLFNLRKMQTLWTIYFPFHADYLKNGIIEVKKKIADDNNLASWPITDAVYIWPWLHTIAIDIDLNGGYEEKRAFIYFIPEIIACSICKRHYAQHKNELIRALQKTTCANTLLALHTYINTPEGGDEDNDDKSTMTKTAFVYDNKLVNLFFSVKYKKDYLTLKTSYE